MQTISFLEEKKFNGFDDIATIKQTFFEKRITVSYDPITDEDNIRRVIFTCSKTLRNGHLSNINLECNGLILEASKQGDLYKWRPLVVPLLSPRSNVNTREINGFLQRGLYNVFFMEDGTILNLYYYKDKWCFATARGIEMNECVFNTKTYQVMFEECLEKMLDIGEEKMTKEDFWNSLNKNKCYTFGFKHPDMHPFWEKENEPIYKVWFVQSRDLNNIKKINNRSEWSQIKNQKRVNRMHVENMFGLYKRLKSSYQDYLEDRPPTYGYLLVSNNPDETKDHSVIMLESSLMTYIRNSWYNGHYGLISKNKNYDREMVILLNAFLKDDNKEIFLTLYQRYAELFNKWDDEEKEFIDNVYNCIASPENECDELVKIAAEEVKSIITLELHEKPHNKIRDIIHNTEHLDYYYKLFKKKL